MSIRVLCAAGLAATAIATFSIGSPPIGEDFNAGSTGHWSPVDPLANNFGPTSFGVSNGAYRITSQPLPPVPQTIGAGSAFVPSMTGGGYADGTLRFTIRFHNGASNGGMYMRSPANASSGYFFFLNNFQNVIGIADVAVGSGNIAAAGLPIAEDVDYVVEAKAIGSELSIKAWPKGAAEPESPQVSIKNTLYADGGLAAIAYNQPSNLGGAGGTLDVSFDDVTFTPLGTKLVDDFTTTLDSWTTLVFGNTQPDLAASEGRAVISSDAPAANTDLVVLANLPSIADPEAYSEGTVRATFTTRDSNVSIYIRGNPIALTSYDVTFRPTDGLLLMDRNAGSSEVQLATTTTPYGNDQELVLELGAVGSTLSARIWAVGEPRPTEPMLTAEDDTFPVGGIALGTDGPAVIKRPAPFDVQFGDVWFTQGSPECAPADLTCDGAVGPADLTILLGSWGTSGAGDLDGDGIVGAADLAILLGAWT